MASSLLDLIRATRIFSSLSPEASQFILTKCASIEIKANNILFHQGDVSDGVYLLLSGRMTAEMILHTGEVKRLGYIEPGETVGELGALSNDPRSLTIRALRDSKLLKISIADFAEICRRYPSVLFAIVNPIISRSNSIIQMLSAGKADKHIVVFPANAKVSLKEFADHLQKAADKYPNILCVSDYHDEFSAEKQTDIVKEKIKKLAKLKKSSARILYIVGAYDHPLAKIALKNADMVYIACDINQHKLDERILDKIHKRRIHMRTDPALVLIHPKNAESPKNTANWLSQGTFSLYHHVRLDNKKDFQRLLRFIRGRAVGVVLSGGGTRGWAHLGVIKALREAKIPIDMIGGTSAGGVVAACYATTNSFAEMREKFYNIVTHSSHSIAWRSITWPTISLFNGKSFTQSQKEAFGDLRIENLWLPYFCVSCNLAKNAEEIHRAGFLWQTLRASTSIPGIIPPMVMDGDIHVDGGLLNNLPVDVMRNFLGPKSRIIAVELNSFVPQPAAYDFPPALIFKDAFFSRFGWCIKHYKFPNFVDTFLQSLFVGSLAKATNNGLTANVLISLELSNYKLLHSNPDEAESMIKQGYEETLKQLSKRKEDNEKPIE